jgi:hypothetical protein
MRYPISLSLAMVVSASSFSWGSNLRATQFRFSADAISIAFINSDKADSLFWFASLAFIMGPRGIEPRLPALQAGTLPSMLESRVCYPLFYVGRETISTKNGKGETRTHKAAFTTQRFSRPSPHPAGSFPISIPSHPTCQ